MSGVNSQSIQAWLRRMTQAKDRAIQAAMRAIDELAEMVLAEAMELCPVSPTDPKHPLYIGTSGALRDSGTAIKAELVRGEIFAIVAFNTDYAAAVHERSDLSHQYEGAVNPRAQWKYLETAINHWRPKFKPYIAEAVARALN